MRQIRRFLIPSITLLFFSIFILIALAQEKLPEIVRKIEPSTVVILTYDKDGKMIGQGSGFFISQSGDIITNRHVLTGVYRAEVKTAREKVYPITMIVGEDKEGDIIRASVNIPLESVRLLSVSMSIPEVGERIAVIGTPFGLERTVSDGIVSAVREIPTFGNIYQITAPLSPGSSGSPVVNMRGEVIGVATFQFVEGQNLNFAIPGERIAKLKKEKGKTLDQWKTGRTEESHTSAEGLYNAGLNFLWGEDYVNALPYFEKAVNKDPDNHDQNAGLYFFIGYCNYKLGRYVEAVVAFKQAVRIKPNVAEAQYSLGVAYNKLGYYGYETDMLEAFKQAIRIKPDYVDAHNNLGAIYYKMGRRREAIEAFKQAIRIEPDYADAHCNLGKSYAMLGRYVEAIEAFKQAIRIKPNYADAHCNLGVVYVATKDRGSALEQYKILKNLDSELANKLFNMIYE